MSALETLLRPLTRQSFLTDHWESSPALVCRQEPEFYENLLTLGDIDAFLGTADFPEGTVRLLRDGTETPSKQVNRDSAFRHFGSGGTVTLNGLQRNLPRLAELCAAVGSALGCRMQTNIYLTPPGGQGFAPHYDDHDVFILQVLGYKRWRVYADPPLPLPLKGQTHKKTAEAPTPKHAEPVIDADLQQGDLLYIPRGFVHEARSADVTSMHITLGIHGTTWLEIFGSALKRLADQDVRFRQAPPPSLAGGIPGEREQALRTAEDLKAVFQSLSVENILDECGRQTVGQTPPLTGPRLLDIEGARALQATSRVARRPGVRLRVEITGDVTIVLFNQKKVELPPSADTLAHFIAATPEFALGDAPQDLGPSGVASVVSNLIREGALVLR